MLRDYSMAILYPLQKVVTQGRHEPPPARCESKNGRAGFRDAKMPKTNRFECHGVDRDTPSVLFVQPQDILPDYSMAILYALSQVPKGSSLCNKSRTFGQKVRLS